METVFIFFYRFDLFCSNRFFSGVSVRTAAFLFLLVAVPMFIEPSFGYGRTISGENLQDESNCTFSLLLVSASSSGWLVEHVALSGSNWIDNR